MSKFIDPIFELIRADGYIQASKILNLAIGVNESVLFSELASKYAYFVERDLLTEDGYFYNTSTNLYIDTGITEKMQRKALANLKRFGLIDVQLRGLPAKRFFKVINDRTLIEKWIGIGQEKRKKALDIQSLPKRYKLDCTKGTVNKNKNKIDTPISEKDAKILGIIQEVAGSLQEEWWRRRSLKLGASVRNAMTYHPEDSDEQI